MSCILQLRFAWHLCQGSDATAHHQLGRGEGHVPRYLFLEPSALFSKPETVDGKQNQLLRSAPPCLGPQSLGGHPRNAAYPGKQPETALSSANRRGGRQSPSLPGQQGPRRSVARPWGSELSSDAKVDLSFTPAILGSLQHFLGKRRWSQASSLLNP